MPPGWRSQYERTSEEAKCVLDDARHFTIINHPRTRSSLRRRAFAAGLRVQFRNLGSRFACALELQSHEGCPRSRLGDTRERPVCSGSGQLRPPGPDKMLFIRPLHRTPD
jgi:hypothetical protein